MAEVAKATVVITPDLTEMVRALRSLESAMEALASYCIDIADTFRDAVIELEATDSDESEAEVDHG